MQQRGRQKGLGPTFGPASRALVLGTYPSPKSFDSGYNYGHPQNRFWPLLAALAGSVVPQSVVEKKALILKSNLALWDVLERCTILGASDASIRDPVPNDIGALVRKTRIEAVFCNGTAAYNLYTKFCEQDTGIAAVKLPSTSPANAAFSMQKLLCAWQPLQAYMPAPADM